MNNNTLADGILSIMNSTPKNSAEHDERAHSQQRTSQLQYSPLYNNCSSEQAEDSAYSEAESACNVFRDEGLTYEMAHAFIDRILVHSKERIEIQWKFRDFLEEPTGTEEHEKE